MADETDRDGEDEIVRPRIFLSYTRAEQDIARTIVSLLEGAGFDVWWDDLLEGGDTYLPTTEAALEAADCVVVLWSELSVNSNWVRDEAQFGREQNRLVPLSLDGTMAPLGFRQIQMIDIQGWTGDAQSREGERIIAAVRAQAQAGDDEDAMQRNAVSGVAAATARMPRPGPTHRPALSRRALLAGGVVAGSGALAFGAWQLKLFGSPTEDTVSMAVLRFANLTGDADQAWFSDGLSGELRRALARNPLLRVSAPTSSTAMADADEFEIGRLLGVKNILRGSVQRSGTVMRISTELVQVADGLIRWAESYDRTLDDVLAVQSEIADSVATALIAQIVSEDEVRKTLDQQKEVGGTGNVAAYEAYLRGLAFYDLSSGEESDRAALAQFDAAIAADPAFASAWAMRAIMLSGIANWTSGAEAVADLFKQSMASAQRSIELEPNLVRGHLALAFAFNSGRLDRSAAYPHYAKAQALAPGDADTLRSVAIFYAYGDQADQAVSIIDKVLELDPLNARAFRSAAFIALLARDYDLTIRRVEQALALNPTLASAYYAMACAYHAKGDWAEAHAAFEKEPVPLFSRVGQAITLDKRAGRTAAQPVYDAIVSEYGDSSLYQQAQILAQWGESDAAITVLQRAFAESDPGVLLATNDVMLDPIRNRPEFGPLIATLAGQ
ncbi:TIR domain-containing protein [Algimonas porphyrae]|uniref:TIR domain-containing protein n=1 Tax=Algimonas porphyrae TaxID=1128113 RepID=A0ABQ5V0A4_9PROT|nr:TIR domain-containing protein [Algimonas porphyrae]GLQ20936.1 hypothetical protein GCM10007854_18910 [Algimonas porphyrae]